MINSLVVSFVLIINSQSKKDFLSYYLCLLYFILSTLLTTTFIFYLKQLFFPDESKFVV